MKTWNMILILLLIAGVLVGCGGDTSTSSGEEASVDPAQGEEYGTYTSAALNAYYEGALPASSQLALGTLELEETENAVTSEQAETLLSLWQAIQGGSLQSDVEIDAVLKQIEGAMTTEQLAAIAAMRLTFADTGAWMQEEGVSFGPPQGLAGGQNPFGNMIEEERSAMRATAQAGGGMFGGNGQFGNISEEEREAMRATAEASGMTLPDGDGRGGAGRGQLTVLAEQVVELLTRRAAE